MALTRALALVDIYLQRENDGAAVKVDASATLSVRNTCASGYLLPDRLAEGVLIDKEDIVSGPEVLDVPIRSGGNSAARRFFTFYTPEYDCSAGTLGFYLKGVAVQNESVPKRTYVEITFKNGNGTPGQPHRMN